MVIFDGKISFGLWALVLLTLINANNADGDVASAFKEFDVTPDVVPVPPTILLNVTYPNYLVVNKGNELTPTQVKDQPKVEYEADDYSFYTLIMTDPDAPSRADPKLREFKHWIVTNIPGNKIEKGEILAEYIGSGPPKDTGLHRYVFLLYKQLEKLVFDEKPIPNTSREGRPKFKAAEFANKYYMGNPIAGNFFQAQYDDYVPILQAQLSKN